MPAESGNSPYKSRRHHNRKALFAAVEAVERRIFLSGFTVSSLASSGANSLYQAIIDADASPGTDVITFTTGALSGTINLTSPLPFLTTNITIDGPGASALTVAGTGVAGFGSIFTVTSGVTATIENLTITAGNSQGDGGGITNYGTLTVTDSTISGNTAGSGSIPYTVSYGGGIYNSTSGNLTVVGSTISGNTILSTANYTYTSGGGIGGSGTINVINSTITGNTADYGGGVYSNGTLTVTDSTISRNSVYSSSGGGGILSNGTLTLEGSIIADNTGVDLVNAIGTIATGANDLIGDGSDVTHLTSPLTGDPLLGTLTNNGGPTQTEALLTGSRAIGAGAVFPAANGVDQRGDARIPGSVDIGAFQSTPPPTFTVNTLADPSTPTAGTLSLREAIADAHSTDGGIIDFASGLTGTIQLASGLELGSNVVPFAAGITIDGPGASLLTVAGTGLTGFGTVFTIDPEITAQIENLTITGGNSFYAGGISNDGTLTITDTIVTGNTTTNNGGGIFSDGTLTVIESTISGNSAKNSGGGIDDSGDTTATILYSTISGNTAKFSGGGIYNNGYGAGGNATLTVTNSTITGNSATSYGGGIENGSGTATITDCTINGNSTSSLKGGGLFMASSSPQGATTTTTLNGSIVAGNTGGDVAGFNFHVIVSPFVGTFTGSYDLIGDGSDASTLTHTLVGTVSSPLNPLLGPLANNGGPTQTEAPLPSSPVIGANTTFAASFDQRGVPRIPGSVDIGAYQTQPVALSTNVTNLNDSGAGSLRQAIINANTTGGTQTITFQSGLTGTIALASPLPDFTTNTTVDGPGIHILTVQRAGSVFTVDFGITTQIYNLTIAGGIADNGSLLINGNVSTGALSGAGNLVIGTEGQIGALTIANGAGTSTQFSLSISNGCTLDITNNTFDITFNGTADPIGIIHSYLTTGFADGSWNGQGIISSYVAGKNASLGALVYAIGYVDGSQTPGVPGAPAGTIELLPTLVGDANLDGAVNASDYLLIDNGFNNHLTSWYNGDFNYDGVINGDDYTLIDNAHNTQGVFPGAIFAAATAQVDSIMTSAASSTVKRTVNLNAQNIFANQPITAIPGNLTPADSSSENDWLSFAPSVWSQLLSNVDVN